MTSFGSITPIGGFEGVAVSGGGLTGFLSTEFTDMITLRAALADGGVAANTRAALYGPTELGGVMIKLASGLIVPDSLFRMQVFDGSEFLAGTDYIIHGSAVVNFSNGVVLTGDGGVRWPCFGTINEDSYRAKALIDVTATTEVTLQCAGFGAASAGSDFCIGGGRGREAGACYRGWFNGSRALPDIQVLGTSGTVVPGGMGGEFFGEVHILRASATQHSWISGSLGSETGTNKQPAVLASTTIPYPTTTDKEYFMFVREGAGEISALFTDLYLV